MRYPLTALALLTAWLLGYEKGMIELARRTLPYYEIDWDDPLGEQAKADRAMLARKRAGS